VGVLPFALMLTRVRGKVTRPARTVSRRPGRVRSIETHELPMTRAVFMQGRSPYKFMPAFRMKLFLSANPDDVAEATELGYPAGQVVGSVTRLAEDDPRLSRVS
jgi:hypothetical protein